MSTYLFNVKEPDGTLRQIEFHIVEQLTMKIKYEALPIYEKIIAQNCQTLLETPARLLELMQRYPALEKVMFAGTGELETRVPDRKMLTTLMASIEQVFFKELKAERLQINCSAKDIYDLLQCCIDYRGLSQSDTASLKDINNWYYQTPELIEEVLHRCIFRFSRFANLIKEGDEVEGVQTQTA